MVYGFIFYIEYGEVGMDNEDIVDLGSDEDIVNDFVMETSPIIRENIKKYFIREIKDKYISENAIDMEITYALEKLLTILRV
tara:strand:- start:266 stop:511 length:246 start_codon:yes stop_codon:yes gene_type:complete